MARRIRTVTVTVDVAAVPTCFVGPDSPAPEKTPLVLLPGFDSSCLEFRRLLPRLEAQGLEAWAVDLLGWGFTPRPPGADFSPAGKRRHLKAFLDAVLGPVTGGSVTDGAARRRPILVGCSLGGAAAIDFAVAHPESISGLVLVDAQGYIDGLGPMASLPESWAYAGVRLQRERWLRRAANTAAYFAAEYATEDAMRVGRLHTSSPGWEDASVAFMRSGGYALSRVIRDVKAPVLLMWGEEDGILGGRADRACPAYRFEADVAGCELAWLRNAGHMGHLETPDAVCERVVAFVAGVRAGEASGARVPGDS